jgi:hypothetical protein
MAHRLSRLGLLGRGFCRLTPSFKPAGAEAGAGAALTFNHGSHNTASRLDPKFHTIARSFSSTAAGGGTGLNANPSYQIYGENTAFTMKCIMPGFRIVGNRTVIMETSKKGRLLLEFTPRQAHDNAKFAWDRSLKFALSAEEIGTLVARLSTLQPVEFARQTAQNSNAQYGFHGNNNDKGMGSLQKVFRAIPNSDGSIQFSVDYELDGRGGQDPPNPKESVRMRLMEWNYLSLLHDRSADHLLFSFWNSMDQWRSVS